MGWKLNVFLCLIVVWQGFSWYHVIMPSDLCTVSSKNPRNRFQSPLTSLSLQSGVCVTPVLDFAKDRFDLCVFVGQRERHLDKLVLEKRDHDFNEAHETTVTIPMYPTTREKNGTLVLTAVVTREIQNVLVSLPTSLNFLSR